ncbi:MAG: formylglycine-generating enzyme family protein [Hyphomonadaceae bacterium]
MKITCFQPVGGKIANSFGLHDMIGNRSELVEDCYHPDYSLQPSDGSSYRPPSCSTHVSRGGASHLDPVRSRSANRIEHEPSPHKLDGFRIARLPN